MIATLHTSFQMPAVLLSLKPLRRPNQSPFSAHSPPPTNQWLIIIKAIKVGWKKKLQKILTPNKHSQRSRDGSILLDKEAVETPCQLVEG